MYRYLLEIPEEWADLLWTAARAQDLPFKSQVNAALDAYLEVYRRGQALQGRDALRAVAPLVEAWTEANGLVAGRDWDISYRGNNVIEIRRLEWDGSDYTAADRLLLPAEWVVGPQSVVELTNELREMYEERPKSLPSIDEVLAALKQHAPVSEVKYPQALPYISGSALVTERGVVTTLEDLAASLDDLELGPDDKLRYQIVRAVPEGPALLLQWGR